MCGAAAVLLLFAHHPLLFNHGLRANTMDAPLVLAYCGGVFHFLAWARRVPERAGEAESGMRDAAHAVAVGLYFVLGFMTKFVAALFLPLVIAAVGASVDEYRGRIVRHWRLWAGVGVLALALIAPWFAWAHLRYGGALWQSMVGDHVLRRVTSSLDPTHVQPWYFYPSILYTRLRESDSATLVFAGLIVLTFQVARRRWPEGVTVIAWSVLPLILMSASTSKLYHYTYPFLPPLALGAGYVATLAVLLAPAPLSRAVRAFDEYKVRRLPHAAAFLGRDPLRRLLLGASAGALVVAIVSVTYGPIQFAVGATEIRSSGVFRPVIVAFVCALLAGAVTGASRRWVVVLVLGFLPLGGYRQSVAALFDNEGPIRAVRDCVLQVQSGLGATSSGLYVDLPDAAVSYPLYYYFRKVRPWIRPGPSATAPSERRADGVLAELPSLVLQAHEAGTGQALSPTDSGPARGSVPTADVGAGVVIRLPGPYAACAHMSPGQAGRPT
jgi:hypothetical protein